MERRINCLNTVRLLAAMQVLIGHAVQHLDVPLPEVLEKILSLLPGVPVFFGLSGYLIWYSVKSSQSLKHFLKKRFFRIYPELWAGILVEVAVMLVLYEQAVPVKDWLLMAFAQGTVFQFWTPNSMRLYGCGAPNGSLWTICVLVQFYLIAYLLYKLLHGRQRRTWGIALAASVAASVVCAQMEPVLPEILYKLLEHTIAPYLWLFLLGALAAEWSEKLLPFARKYGYVFLGVSVLTAFVGFDVPSLRYGAVQCGCLLFGLLGFAYRFPKLNVRTDISYGLYIYHMIVINAMIALGLKGSAAYMLIAVAVSAVLAFASAKTVARIGKGTLSGGK